MKNHLQVYAVGGAGTNLAQKVINIPTDAGFPSTKTTIIDISDSNIQENNPHGVYLVPGLSGAGKDRAAAYRAASPYVEDILNKHVPGAFNILVGSAAGGTGSVLLPLIAEELLKRDIPFVCFVVGSITCGKETDNTFKTVLGLQHLSKRTEKPVVMSYYENSPTKNDEDNREGKGLPSEVDAQIEEDVRALALLISEQHIGLDRKDIFNWLRYTNVCSVPAQLVEMFVQRKGNDSTALKGAVISTASLMANRDCPIPQLNQQYLCDGYYRPELTAREDCPRDLHFLLTPSFVPTICNNLKKVNEEYKQAEAKLKEAPTLDLSGFEVDEGGLLF